MSRILFVIGHFLQPIQMQLSLKQKPFAQFFAGFLKCISNFEHLEKNMTLIGYVISKLESAKDVVS